MKVALHRRYGSMLPAAMLIVIIGIFLGDGRVISLAVFPLSFLLFGALSNVPDPELKIKRTIEPQQPMPGDDINVTLTVENIGETPVPDLRLADGVPEPYTILDSQPSLSTTLAPGDTKQIQYTLSVSRSRQTFDPPSVRVRDIAADKYNDVEIDVEGDKTCTAEVFIDNPPTAQEAETLMGAVTSDTGGSGVEFHSVRQYRPGDPINRIDWRRLARKGGLWTIDFAEYGGVSVFVLTDCRPETDVYATSQRSTGVELAQYAADRIVHSLEAAGHEAGFAALGTDLIPFVQPGSSEIHVKTRAALRAIDGDTEWDGSYLSIDDFSSGIELAGRLTDQLQPGTQIVFLTPLGDNLPVTLVQKLRAHGHRVTVIIPGAFESDNVGERLVHATRQARITRLRDSGADIITWSQSDPLPVALAAQETGEHV